MLGNYLKLSNFLYDKLGTKPYSLIKLNKPTRN